MPEDTNKFDFEMYSDGVRFVANGRLAIGVSTLLAVVVIAIEFL